MVRRGAEEIVLETEADNVAALSFYRKLGFIKEKRLHRCAQLLLSGTQSV